jgi:hypothetical protein
VVSNNVITQPFLDVPDLFTGLEQSEFLKVPSVPAGSWTGKIRLETTDNKRLIVSNRTNQIVLTSKTDGSDGKDVIFTVLDADISKQTEPNPRLGDVSLIYHHVHSADRWIFGTDRDL